MRINGKHQAIAMAALLLASCSQKEVLPVDSTPEGEYRYTLQIDAATRAVFDNDHMAWQEGDRIGWFTDRDGSSEVNMDTTPRSFSVSSTAALGAGARIYAYAPFHAGSQDKTAVALSIPLEQDGDAVRDAMPLVATPVTVETPVEAGTDTPVGTALFCNLGAMIRYNVYTSDPYFAGEKVESVSFTATTALAGDFTYDITRVSLDQVPAIGGLTGTSVRSSLSTPAEVGGSRETGVKVCQVLAPGTYSGTFTVFTDKAAYSFSVTDASFERSRLRPVSLDLSVAGARQGRNEYLLTAHPWVLKSVLEEGGGVTTSAGNKVTLRSDYSLEFDCTANGGMTFDHTWAGELIAPDTYGAVSSMSWCTWSEDGKEYLEVDNGFLLVFAQESEEYGIYEIKELTESRLEVEITSYDEVWTLVFEAEDEDPVEELLTAHPWVLSDVREEGNSVGTSDGNVLVLNRNHTMSFDCSANDGYTFDHTWAGALIRPDDYDPVSGFSWSTFSSDGKDYLSVDYGYLLVFAQEDMTGTYEIKELTESRLEVEITSYEGVWTLVFLPESADGFAPEGYTAVWCEEFTSEDTLASNWTFESGGDGWGNGEAQYYCAGGTAPDGVKTARVVDGVLRITARKVAPSAATEGCSYVSARMSTQKTWKYGYIEMKARLPEEKGTWSAFWMLPDDRRYPSWVRDPSHKGGELDIVEYVPNDHPGRIYASAHSYNATRAAGTDSGYRDPASGTLYSYTGNTALAHPGSQWHYYGLEWTHTYVKAYLDGVPYYYAPNPSPDYATPDANPDWGFDKDYYIKLNLAIGGSWGGTPDPDFTEATYEIDWVRVHQQS